MIHMASDMVNSYEQGIVRSGSIKGGEFLTR